MAQQDFDIIPIVDRNLMTKIEGDATDNQRSNHQNVLCQTNRIHMTSDKIINVQQPGEEFEHRDVIYPHLKEATSVSGLPTPFLRRPIHIDRDAGQNEPIAENEIPTPLVDLDQGGLGRSSLAVEQPSFGRHIESSTQSLYGGGEGGEGSGGRRIVGAAAVHGRRREERGFMAG